VADDLNAAGDTAAEVQTIYHYTDVASALAIITSGHFWFTERAHLNDTLELQYGLRIGHEMFDAAVKAAGDVVPRDAPEHLMGEVGFGMIEFGYWIASFSYEGDDLAQWRSYADEGRGVCLGFPCRNWICDSSLRIFRLHSISCGFRSDTTKRSCVIGFSLS
jgi:hypothetical protein